MGVNEFKLLTLVSLLCLVVAQFVDYKKNKNKIELFLLMLYVIMLICMIIVSIGY